jgi:hypothetical protein
MGIGKMLATAHLKKKKEVGGRLDIIYCTGNWGT